MPLKRWSLFPMWASCITTRAHITVKTYSYSHKFEILPHTSILSQMFCKLPLFLLLYPLKTYVFNQNGVFVLCYFANLNALISGRPNIFSIFSVLFIRNTSPGYFLGGGCDSNAFAGGLCGDLMERPGERHLEEVSEWRSQAGKGPGLWYDSCPQGHSMTEFQVS